MYGIDDLILFIKTVEIGSFANTAKVLKVAPQAVSRRLRNMEKRFGMTLIHATTREFKLTEAGEKLYALLQHSYEAVETMLRDTEEFIKDKYEPQGTIRVVLPIGLSLHLISPYLPQFSIKYPKIDLQVSYLNSTIDLTSDGYDLAILNYIPAQQHLKIKNIFNIKGKLYCSRQYADKYGIPMTPEELVNHRVVGGINIDGNVIPHYQMTNLKTGEVMIIKVAKHLLINNTLHSLPLLRSNEVICPGFEDINLDLEQDDIVVVLPDYYFIELKFYLVFHPHARDLKIKLFSDFLKQCLKNKI
ncbi:MAG: LysR family transcriptional regulator [Proteobacteria bacterium]|nr:MAG: LysR family transcriptional regulator [Pseudomonadota bacterium]